MCSPVKTSILTEIARKTNESVTCRLRLGCKNLLLLGIILSDIFQNYKTLEADINKSPSAAPQSRSVIIAVTEFL